MLLFKLAYRNILRQRRRSLLTALSIAGGYVLFSFVLSLIEGSYGNAIEFFTSDHVGHVQIHEGDFEKRPRVHKNIETGSIVEAKLGEHPDVAHFSSRIFTPALAYGEEKTTPTQVIGIDVDREPRVSTIRQKVVEGSYFTKKRNDDGYYQALVGATLADQLNLVIGSELILISQGADGSIANDIFIVTGVVGNRNSFDRTSVYLPLAAAQEFLTMPGRVHEYVVTLGVPAQNERVADELSEQLPNLTVLPWQKIEESFYNAMQQDREGNKITMGIVVFLVFIGVLNTVLMSVMERTTEFGVLKAIGSRPADLVKLICLETTLLAFFSVIAGIVIAVPMNIWLTQVGFRLPEPVDLGGVSMQAMRGVFNLDVFVIPMLFMMITAVVIALPPGIRAGRIQPRDALGRH